MSSSRGLYSLTGTRPTTSPSNGKTRESSDSGLRKREKSASTSNRSPSVKPSASRSSGTSSVKRSEAKDSVPLSYTSVSTRVTDQKGTSASSRSPSVGTRSNLPSTSYYTNRYSVTYKSGDEVMYQKKVRATFLGLVKGSYSECTIVTQDGMIMWVPKSDLQKT